MYNIPKPMRHDENSVKRKIHFTKYLSILKKMERAHTRKLKSIFESSLTKRSKHSPKKWISGNNQSVC